MENANSFTLFSSYFDALEYLPDDVFGAMMRAMCKYALRGEEPTFDDAALNSYWTLIRPTLERSIKRAKAGRLGGQGGAGVSRNSGNNNASKSKANQNGINSDKEKELELGLGIGEERTEEIGEEAIAYPYKEVVRLWNEICSPLPKVKSLNDSRRKKIKCRLVEFSKNSEQWLPKTQELFERVMASDFLRGDKSDWQATFDWVFENSKNWVKVMEGNYDNERRSPKAASEPAPKLGVGEFIAQDGTRRYGTGNLPPVPFDAPPRPDNDSLWSRETNTWIPSGV